MVPAEPVTDRQAAPRRPDKPVSLAPADAPAPTGAAAAVAAGVAAGTAALGLLALLTLLPLAAPRLGRLLRLAEAGAPLPPLLALPERPG